MFIYFQTAYFIQTNTKIGFVIEYFNFVDDILKILPIFRHYGIKQKKKNGIY